jgi:Holliday junction DNA helicase RuvA
MIAFLRGLLLEKDSDSVIVDVHGVGYRATVSLTTLAGLPAVGAAVQLRIYTHVREDIIALFGFLTPGEEELFHHLTSVSGVGPKLALNVLSGMAPEELALALAQKEIVRLVKINGVGKKTAERLVMELSDKMKTSGLLAKREIKTSVQQKFGDDLVSALVNLGYRPADAEKASAAARERAPEADMEGLVRLALQLLTSKAV